MMNRRRVVILAVFIVCLAVAAGYLFSLRTPGETYSDVDELVADLRRNGVQCRDLVVSPPEQTENLGGEFGFCYIGERNVNIHVYEDPDRVAGHVEGNVSVRGDNPNYFTSLVRGSNWVVDTYSEETSESVQNAIGGVIE